MKQVAVIFFILLLCSCEKVIRLDLPDRDPRLVVDGLLTNEKSPCYVTLSKTTKYTFIYDTSTVIHEEGAVVIISDDSGTADTLQETTAGKYMTHPEKIQGAVGRSYKIDIFTGDGKHYASEMEQMLAVAKIDSIYFSRDQTITDPTNPSYYLYDIYINWHDPANEPNYYLRDMSYYWSGRWHENVQWNWVFSDKYIDGSYLEKDNVNESYGGKGWSFRLNQYSLTKQAYDFWNLVHQQTQQGNDYANSSVPLIGNIINADNPNDYALGYFQVSAKTTADLYIDR